MVKFFTLLSPFILFSSVFGAEQLVLVLAPEMNSTGATMQRYSKEGVWQKTGEAVAVTLGRNGLGWSDGENPLKYEGDGRSPAGVFAITRTFGSDLAANSAMPYVYADENVICIDESSDERYNQIAVLDPAHPPKSYETMRRTDEVYRNGAIVEYNAQGEKGRGSCIFIHLNHPDHRPTAGCTAMEESALKELLGWFDPSKNPVMVQIPKRECEKYQQEFTGIDCR
ncbi:MAG: L,D-transpeptidase family protein [Sulfuricurvum sp.]|jgi:D-alanyl-D-alanine dipeptidase|uniref:L,D-transpeptidase family protein n=1 Tax=Sulfuricurvum sp. TaxID=2025608 RepID=UPI0025D35ECC|nr:L,D-transpeptidase family protein [Sulfuricurvum sp.]MCK9373319.1 L,D-transpeptidase family protein [Sulfuricurvum sp.]